MPRAAVAGPPAEGTTPAEGATGAPAATTPAAAPAAAPEVVEDDEDEEAFEEQIRVYQQKPFMRKLRLEVSPTFGVPFNETQTRHISVGGEMSFHVTDFLFFGGSYEKFFHEESTVFHELEDSFGVFPERKLMDFYAGGHIGYVPLYGKFILFDVAIVHYDAYLIAGAGVTRTFTVGQEGANRVTGNFGLGGRIFLTQWLTLNVEVRDYIYNEEFKAEDSIVNNVMFHTGLSVFFPFKYDYRYAK